jgi:hypothetical protein
VVTARNAPRLRAARPSALMAALVLVLGLGFAGCAQAPAEGPEEVAQRFYELISAAKAEGGPTPAMEAYKLIDTRHGNLGQHQFLEIVKRYPPEFKASVGAAEVKGTQALVAISFPMPSSFGGSYEVKQLLALNLDPQTNTWKVDFTGDTYGASKDDLAATARERKPDR